MDRGRDCAKEDFNMPQDKRTIIGVLAGHDTADRNNELAELLDAAFENNKLKCVLEDGYHFLFTGGTYGRVILGKKNNVEDQRGEKFRSVKEETKNWLIQISTRLPEYLDGGVTLLSHLIVERKCGILWSFLTPVLGHWLNPENLALMRLCDIWHVKRLMNQGSAMEWLEKESSIDKTRNLQDCPPSISFISDHDPINAVEDDSQVFYIPISKSYNNPALISEQTIALISHDQMKGRMVDFAIDHEYELAKFKQVLTTSTTGSMLRDASRLLENKIKRCYSGPKGGDIEIATEVLYGKCHAVIFFVDPSNPHPHIDDIRVVFGACMLRDNVRMLTNEMHAREWIKRVVRFA